jgi:hypothetical protein
VVDHSQIPALKSHDCPDEQVWHVNPLLPQSASVSPGRHPVGPQQPVQFCSEHVAGEPQVRLLLSQTPPLHETHVAPPVPHAVELVPASHTPLVLQQPVAHVLMSHS